MSNMEARLNTDFDVWFEKVRALTLDVIKPDEDWAELWFDGFTPEESIQERGIDPS